MLFQVSKSFARNSIPTFKSSLRSISVGAKIPAVDVFEGSPGTTVNLAEESASGKSVFIGVPGAFSPGCSNSHIPGYLKNLRAFNEKGYTNFFVIAVNDAFVTKAWGEQLLENKLADDQIRFIADAKGEFTEALDLLFDASKFFGNHRSKRYALLVEDGKVVKTFVEPDNTSVDVSDAEKVLNDA